MTTLIKVDDVDVKIVILGGEVDLTDQEAIVNFEGETVLTIAKSENLFLTFEAPGYFDDEEAAIDDRFDLYDGDRIMITVVEGVPSVKAQGQNDEVERIVRTINQLPLAPD